MNKFANSPPVSVCVSSVFALCSLSSLSVSVTLPDFVVLGIRGTRCTVNITGRLFPVSSFTWIIYEYIQYILE